MFQLYHIDYAHSSLQIFDDESHASMHSDRTKEGLSLFGMYNHNLTNFWPFDIQFNISGILDATRTSLGRRLLRNWCLRPSISLSIIASRHNALSCFLRPENLVTANAMHGHLKGIGNVPHAFALLRGGKAGVREWQAIVKVICPLHWLLTY